MSRKDVMIKILTDSVASIPADVAREAGIDVVTLFVNREGCEYADSEMDLDAFYADIYDMVDNIPTSSQPSQHTLEAVFEEAARAGDEVLGIFLSHELSGTWQCAKLAADLANVDNVLFVDSATVCLGESLLVRLAVQLRDAGKTLVQIATDLEHAKEHLHLVAAIDDLKYLRKGGRLPAAVAVAGGMLGIKPSSPSRTVR